MPIILTPQKPPYYEKEYNVLVYQATITTSDGNPPQVNIITNKIGQIQWTWTGFQGRYRGTLTNAFADTVWLQIQGESPGYFTTIQRIDNDTIEYIVGTLSGGSITGTVFIEIATKKQ